MAIELISRVLSQPKSILDSSEKLVLTVMGDRADQDGVLWYSLATISYLTSFTRKAVQRILSRLEAKGLVSRMRRSQKSNYYRIAVDKLPLCEIPKKVGETGLVDWIEQEPDLFESVGDLGTPRGNVGDLGTPPGRPSDAFGGDLGTPDSLNDPLGDSPQHAGERVCEEELHAFIIQGWNELAGHFENLAPVRFLSDARKTLIEQRTKEYAWVWPVDQAGPATLSERGLWRTAFTRIGQSKLLTGQKLDWAPTIDWVLKKSNFAKIMEGQYGHGHDRIGSPTTGSRDRSAVAAGREAVELVKRSRHARATARGAAGNPGSAAGARR